MAQKFSRPRGTLDSLAEQSYKYSYIEQVYERLARSLGFGELRTPTFEKTALFSRTSGETSDVVSKEMYSFEDRGGESLSLRPEGTAGAVRAVIESGALNDALPLKLFYFVSCFRYNRPQAGRVREHHQFGMEIFGAQSHMAEAELLLLWDRAFREFGVRDAVSFRINSIGCAECRGRYKQDLLEYFSRFSDRLCETCLVRMEKNPMRLLDCKSEVCREIAAGAPVITDYLCGGCRGHLDSLFAALDAAGIEYIHDPTIVRGLDYYNGPVFEAVTDRLGAQGAVAAGGRYDGLVSELGGNPTPACGFGSGLERLCLLMEECGFQFPALPGCRLFVIPVGGAATDFAMRLKCRLFDTGISCRTELSERSVKASMRFANKIGADFVLVAGEEEISSGSFVLKDMKGGGETVCNSIEQIAAALIQTNL